MEGYTVGSSGLVELGITVGAQYYVAAEKPLPAILVGTKPYQKYVLVELSEAQKEKWAKNNYSLVISFFELDENYGFPYLVARDQNNGDQIGSEALVVFRTPLEIPFSDSLVQNNFFGGDWLEDLNGPKDFVFSTAIAKNQFGQFPARILAKGGGGIDDGFGRQLIAVVRRQNWFSFGFCFPDTRGNTGYFGIFNDKGLQIVTAEERKLRQAFYIVLGLTPADAFK